MAIKSMRTLIIGMLIASSTSFYSPAQQAFALCNGSGCNGLDPASTGCSGGAYTAAYRNGTGTWGTVQVQMRYSSSCVANWTRSVSLGSTRYIRAVISGGFSDSYEIYGGSAYTDMANGYVTNCGSGGMRNSTSGSFSPYVSGVCA
jgi:hypothetical protein